MSVPDPNIRFTYEDYRSLCDAADQRYELMDGEIVMVPAPTTRHQRVSRELEYLILNHVKKHDLGEVFDAPVDVVLGKGKDRQVVQPDIVFVAKERAGIVAEAAIEGAPDLVVEILSPSTEEWDRRYKKAVYARYGVREYWLVAPDTETIEVYVLEQDALMPSGVFAEHEPVVSRLWPDLALDPKEIF
ncbi:MAG TPA: Uma2 family endonuclease [Gammaproteobacteria bacterium]|nr:Uma2 family endonuclease [Gammaproteobacteria bacterium]